MCATVFRLTRFLPRGSRSRRMTHDDSVQTAATSRRARSPASIGARERRAPVGARRRSHRSSNAGRAKRGVSVTTEAKFSGLQGLENSQNAERISTFRVPVPPAGGTPRLDEAGTARGRPPPAVLDQARTSTRVVGGLDPRSLIASGYDTDGKNFPPCKVLKTHETRSESRLHREPTTPSSPRSSRSPASPSAPARADPSAPRSGRRPRLRTG